MSDETRRCLNCGQVCDSSHRFCPLCGGTLVAPPMWPPAPGGRNAPREPQPPVPMITRSSTGDTVIGAVAAVLFTLAIALYGLGVVLWLVGGVILRRYPYALRGMAIGCGLWALVLLGAFIWCIASPGEFGGLSPR